MKRFAAETLRGSCAFMFRQPRMRIAKCLGRGLLQAIVLVAASSTFAFSSMAQSVPGNVFGPATFVRGAGEPKLETRSVNPAGFTGPYVLHLQNGDENGKNRVSSAQIWLGGNLILGPSDFSQQFTGKDIQVGLDSPTNLEVRIESAPGSQLTIRIEGKQISYTNTVGPEGGTLEFGNGVVLEIPPGAVTEQTVISIKDLPLAQVNAILSNPLASSTSTKRFLGGFSAEPDGIVFKVPITAFIPVLPLNPGGIPARIELLLNEQSYRYSSSPIVYYGTSNRVQMEINHFSSPAVVELTPEEWARLAAEWTRINALCTACETNSSPECVAFAAELGEPTNCLISPKNREGCPTAPKLPTDCCKEMGVEVVSVATELTGASCQILGTDLKVVYPFCPNTTPTNFCETETAPVNTDPNNIHACDRLVVTMAISPAEDKVLVIGQTQDYGAKVTGTKDGVEIFKDVTVDPIWNSSDNNIATIDPKTGTVTGVGANFPDFITIGASMSECSPTKALVKVQVVDLDVTPKKSSLFPGESVTLKAFSKNTKGEEIPIDVMWSSDNPLVADVGQPLGTETVVSTNPSIISGVAVIRATHVVTGLTAFAVVTVKNLFVTPELRYLGPGQSVELNAITKDQSGIETPIEVSWSSDNPSVANCNPTVGSNTTINATKGGDAIITAKHEATGTIATAKIVVQDCIESWNWNKYPPFALRDGPDFTTWHPTSGRHNPAFLVSDGLGNLFTPGYLEGDEGSWRAVIGRFDNNSGGFDAIAYFGMVWVHDFFVDGRGNMILLYIPWKATPPYYSNELWARRYNVDRGWDDGKVLLAGPVVPYPAHYRSHIAADARGNAFVVLSVVNFVNDLPYGPKATGPTTVGVWRYDADLGWTEYVEIAHASWDPYVGTNVAKIAMDPRGDAILAWTDQDADGRTILARRYQVGQGWDQVSTQIFSPKVLYDEALNVLMDAKGNVIVAAYAWGSGTWAMHMDNLTGWSSPIRIAQNPDPNYLGGTYDTFKAGGYYRISMDESGNAMVVFEQKVSYAITSLRSRRYIAGVGWDNTVDILEDVYSNNSSCSNLMRGDLAFRMHGSGSATLIATEAVPHHAENCASLGEDTFYSYGRHYTPCTGWSAANSQLAGSSANDPSLIRYLNKVLSHIDTRGNGTEVWLYQTRRDSDGWYWPLKLEPFSTRFTPTVEEVNP